MQNQILPLYLMSPYKTTLFCLIKSFEAQYHIFDYDFVPVYFTQSGFGTGFVRPLDERMVPLYILLLIIGEGYFED